MEKSNNHSEFNLIFKYALKDLSRNYKKISSIIVTLFISLFILSAIFTIEDSLKNELNNNAKALLGGDLEIDYNYDILEIGFNSKYLLDIASQVKGKEIEILLSDSASPALIIDPDQDGVIFVLMPMRV